MNTELLRRILDKARDDALSPAEEDEIRCLLIEVEWLRRHLKRRDYADCEEMYKGKARK